MMGFDQRHQLNDLPSRSKSKLAAVDDCAYLSIMFEVRVWAGDIHRLRAELQIPHPQKDFFHGQFLLLLSKSCNT